ncbi:EamA family transporter [Erwinia sp. OLTSP20]|uniref:threonine/homoserine exporter RhtA n=1 Tax=unclassified Erwinia TaxID=2622719 RepID=UPI000C1836F3|nr:MULTISPECIES: threonine/homoserine exporter RhtA [unclassified Erwinia]PIJ48681.1 threonine/homoserine exporter RhtA [Erwinia sp. OAMSP11]PIJ69305.1 threonine/homoserine exporter RhtA [Erwinia sp. OLSSP12]PIJ79139.1 threonine/homoserine exporter RhtA [Erwinia sp. OLCASP19]PIJ80665.1 threonine/homoserine exporter RhtA [Erwinia sp. OLMTSP26]PIJ82816.1 threonine/homoserine exporter RhtA [Erwinia sp. OLMDSP33]
MYLSRFKSSVWFPVVVLLIAMTSIQGGAALAKTLFSQVGAPGITALRLGLGTLILLLIFKPWRLHFSKAQRLPLLLYGLALGAMNYSFYLAIRTVPLGIAVGLEFCGPLALALASSRRLSDFIWVFLALSGLWLLLPLGNAMGNVDTRGALLALLAGGFWVVYILTGARAGVGNGPATVAMGSLIGALVFVPLGLSFAGSGLWYPGIILPGIAIALLSSALPYSLEMLALTRLPARVFGTLMSLEPAMAALSGMIFLSERLSGMQWLGLLAIISASIGSALSAPRKKIRLETVSE